MTGTSEVGQRGAVGPRWLLPDPDSALLWLLSTLYPCTDIRGPELDAGKRSVIKQILTYLGLDPQPPPMGRALEAGHN